MILQLEEQVRQQEAELAKKDAEMAAALALAEDEITRLKRRQTTWDQELQKIVAEKI